MPTGIYLRTEEAKKNIRLKLIGRKFNYTLQELSYKRRMEIL